MTRLPVAAIAIARAALQQIASSRAATAATVGAANSFACMQLQHSASAGFLSSSSSCCGHTTNSSSSRGVCSSAALRNSRQHRVVQRAVSSAPGSRPASPAPPQPALVGQQKLAVLKTRLPSRADYEQQQAQLRQQLLQQEQAQPRQHTAPPQRQAAVRRDSNHHDALSVSVTGVLHRVSFQNNEGWAALKFKQVMYISNGRSTSEGWQPADVARASEAAAKQGWGQRSRVTASTTSSSRSTSSIKSEAQMHAARVAARWLSVTGTFDNPPRIGATYKLQGAWHKHPDYGWSIKCDSWEEALEEADPKAVLQSLPGVGDKKADSILAAVGSSMQDIIDVFAQPERLAVARLCQVPGISTKIARNLKQAWDKQQGASARQADLLQKLSMPPRLVSRVLQHYGNDDGVVRQEMARNPYALYRVLPGYQLDQADATAAALGFSPAAPERGAAYLLDALWAAFYESHLSLSWSQLEERALEQLHKASLPGWPAGQGLHVAAEQLVQDQRVVVEQQQPVPAPKQQQQQQGQGHHHHKQQQVFEFQVVSSQWPDDAHVYLQELHRAEQDTVEFFIQLSADCCAVLQAHQQGGQPQQQQQQPPAAGARGRHRRSRHQGPAAPAVTSHSSSSSSSSSSSLQLPLAVSAEQAQQIELLQRELSEQLGKPVVFNEGQRVALVLSQLLPLLLLSGGPGCGKTLTSQGIVRSWLDHTAPDELYMAAPTGRAAQRLQELLSSQHADAVSASTIHRLLGYRNSVVAKRLAAEAAKAAAGGKLAAVTADLEADLQDTAGTGTDLDLSSKCEFNRAHPLPQANYLVDEVSMMDTLLSGALLSALSGLGTQPRKLVLVGDPDQLPPVGPGQPVADALAEGLLPCVDLRQIYRTAADSAIVASAHAINQGKQPHFSAVWDVSVGSIEADISRHISNAAAEQPGMFAQAGAGKVLFVRLPDSCAASVVKAALEATAQLLLPRLEDCNPTLDVQVLSPIKGSDMGTQQLNSALQAHFNPRASDKPELASRGRFGPAHVWRQGDRVTHLKNDTQLDVYNGDQGYIKSVDPYKHTLTVRYPPRSRRGGSGSSSSGSDSAGVGSSRQTDDAGAFHRVTYQGADISDMLQLAWATTVHKAQGGEFPVVLLALHTSAGRALRRQLLYTAASRAQQLLVVVGTEAAINKCLERKGVASHAATESSRLRTKLRSARVAAGLPSINRAVYGQEGWGATA